MTSLHSQNLGEFWASKQEWPHLAHEQLLHTMVYFDTCTTRIRTKKHKRAIVDKKTLWPSKYSSHKLKSSIFYVIDKLSIDIV
jgi:hypothetical protein